MHVAQMLDDAWRWGRMGAAIVAAGAVLWLVGVLVGFPRYPGYSASILMEPTGAGKLLAVVFAGAVMVVVGTLLAGRVRYDAGFAGMLVGLWILRQRGGEMSATIRGQESGVFLVLLLELLLLAAVAAAFWGALHWLRERGSTGGTLRHILEIPDASRRMVDRKATREPLDQKLLALGIHAGTTGLIVVLLCRTDARSQVFFSIAIGAFVASLITHAFIPTRPGIWFWMGPVLCGVVGYLWSWLATPAWMIHTGRPGGFLAPLAHPLPLDWVGVGIPFALWGYVRSRTKQLQRISEANETPEQNADSTGAGKPQDHIRRPAAES